MMTDSRIRTALTKEFRTIKDKNPSFSMRAFARRLGLSPSSLCEILQGRRKITDKTIEKILPVLMKSGAMNSSWEPRRFASGRKRIEFEQLALEQFRLISEWHYFALLSLAETEEFQSDPEWMASRLGIDVSRIKPALEVLVRLGLLSFDSRTSTWTPTGKQLATPTDVANSALRHASYESLELARRSLEQDTVDRRDFSNMTITIDPKDLPKAKEKIRKFRRRLMAELEAGEKKEVYRMSIQLYPLTGRGE